MSSDADMIGFGKDVLPQKKGLRLLIVHQPRSLVLRSFEEDDVDKEWGKRGRTESVDEKPFDIGFSALPLAFIFMNNHRWIV